MFFIRVIGVTKVVLDRDALDNSGHSFGAEGGNPSCEHRVRIRQVAT